MRFAGKSYWPVYLLGLMFGLVIGGCGEGDSGGEGGGEVAGEAARGRELFVRNGCPVCHGMEGRGDGKIAATLRPKPRNFRELSAYKQGSGVEDIVKTLKKGVAGGSTMPAYAHLSEEERRVIAHYIKYLQGQP